MMNEFGSTRVATLALVVAVGAVAAGVHLRTTPDPRLLAMPEAVEVRPRGEATIPSLGSSADDIDQLVTAVVAINPFRVDRSSPVATPNGEVFEDFAPEGFTEIYEHPPTILLLGVATSQNAAVAAVEVPGVGNRILRVGEEFEGYTLLEVHPSEARVSGKDSIFVIRLPSTDPSF